MPGEMVERVGSALYAEWVASLVDEEFVEWRLLPDKETWLARARAAIEAMREPTKAMIEVGITTAEDCKDSDWSSGGDGNSSNSYEYYRSDAPQTIFTAMINEALQ